MRKTFKILYLLSIYSIKSTTQSQFGTVFFIVGKLLRTAMFFFFIYTLVTETHVLKGYSVGQALVVLMVFELVSSISGLLFREVYRFRPLVVRGGLDAIITKPFSPLLRVLCGGLDVFDGFVIILESIVFAFLVVQLGPLSPQAVVGFSILMICSIILSAALHILALSLGLLSTSVDQSIMILRDIIEAGRFPIEIYKQPLQAFLTFVFPVGIMMTYPAKALFGTLSYEAIIISCLVAVIGLYLNILLWRFSLGKYQSWGG